MNKFARLEQKLRKLAGEMMWALDENQQLIKVDHSWLIEDKARLDRYHKLRRIGLDVIGPWRISTVLLAGTNVDVAKPFETLVEKEFGEVEEKKPVWRGRRGRPMQEEENEWEYGGRYATVEEAKAGHRYWVEKMRRKTS